MFDKPLIDRPDFVLSQPLLVSDQTAHEPDLTLDADGYPWVIWSERDPDGDRILVRRLDASSTRIPVSDSAGVECQPAIALDVDGTLLCAWAAQRQGVWQIITRGIDDGVPGAERVVASSRDGAFRPRLLAQPESTCILFELVLNQRSRIGFATRRNGTWSDPDTLDTQNANCFRPCVAAHPDGDPIVTFDKYERNRYRIISMRLNHKDNPMRLSDGINRHVQSVVVSDDAGAHWIAWSTTTGNRDNAHWWLTKYATLRRLEDGRLYEPAEEMIGRDLNNEDSFQGWEFPELAVDVYDRVWIFGQASHTLYAQYFSPAGWSERFTIAQRRWGSWKPKIRAVGSDPIYVASMGLNGAQVQRLDVRRPASPPAPGRRLRPVSISTSSSPSATEPSARDRRSPVSSGLSVYFGDLHAHSVYGDAVGDVDELYFRYRDAYGYDFAALTEHDYLDGMQLSQSELAMMWAAADRMTVDGEFVALYGYEWTSPALADHAGAGGTVGEGHRHILYPDKSGPLVSYGDAASNTGKKLLARLDGRRALVIAHHTAWSGTDLEAYDPALSRLIEICSTHGRFEYPGNLPIGYRRDHVHPGKYVVDALARGQRVGFVGGSDSHGLRWHATEMEGRASHIAPGTRVGWKEDAYRTGMTAILAPELTRAALFDALYHRRCYATSGVPIILDFQINGELMGSEISVEGQPRITVLVHGTAPVSSVEIVRQGYVHASRHFPKGERPLEINTEITDPLLIPGETQYYYARITQEDGNMAWSSPIWVTYF